MSKLPVKQVLTTYELDMQQLKVAIMNYLGLNVQDFDDKKIFVSDIEETTGFGEDTYNDFAGVRITLYSKYSK